MLVSSYEEALVGRLADAPRARPPSVIEVAKNIIGRENLRVEIHGTYCVWENGRWNDPLKLDDFIRAANRRLKAQGKPQIRANPIWVV
jgi:hypothetical protein